MKKQNDATEPAISSNGVLVAVLSLVEPSKYSGYSKHPSADNTIRKVSGATITPIKTSTTGWVTLEIMFEDGERFSGASPSARGAKQMFAFQCSNGSKWQ